MSSVEKKHKNTRLATMSVWPLRQRVSKGMLGSMDGDRNVNLKASGSSVIAVILTEAAGQYYRQIYLSRA